MRLPALEPERRLEFEALLASPLGPWSADVADVAGALLNDPEPDRRMIVMLEEGCAAPRMPPPGRRIDLETAPRFADAAEAQRFILQERWDRRSRGPA